MCTAIDRISNGFTVIKSNVNTDYDVIEETIIKSKAPCVSGVAKRGTPHPFKYANCINGVVGDIA